MAKYGAKSKEEVGKAMHEFKLIFYSAFSELSPAEGVTKTRFGLGTTPLSHNRG
jgi:hypothetical protein